MHTECLCQLLMRCVVSHSDVWILSGQVEFLPLDLQRTDKSDELDEDGCKIGLARIREALECVQWPAMVMGSAAPAGRGLASQMEGPARQNFAREILSAVTIIECWSIKQNLQG